VIDVDTKSLSNITTINTQSLIAPTITIDTLTSSGTVIDVDSKSLSNLTMVSTQSLIAPTVTTDTLTSSGTVIDVDTKSLSNLTTINTQSLIAPTITTDTLTSSGTVIDVDSKSLSNLTTVNTQSLIALTITTDTLTSSGTVIDVDAKSLSNLTAIYAQNMHSDTLTSTSITINSVSSSLSNIVCNSAFHIQGFDGSLISEEPLHAVFGQQADTLIGLRVDKNILAPAFLSISDRRVKTDIATSSQVEDLNTLLAIPVVRYRFIEGDGRQIHGFIAQEVEQNAPFAVRTTKNIVPNILRESNRFWTHDNMTFIELPSHGLQEGACIQIRTDLRELVAAVVHVPSPDVFAVNSIIRSDKALFIYGEYVEDFKLLDNEKLIPVVFNAVKELHARIATQDAELVSLRAQIATQGAQIATQGAQIATQGAQIASILSRLER